MLDSRELCTLLRPFSGPLFSLPSCGPSCGLVCRMLVSQCVTNNVPISYETLFADVQTSLQPPPCRLPPCRCSLRKRMSWPHRHGWCRIHQTDLLIKHKSLPRVYDQVYLLGESALIKIRRTCHGSRTTSTSVSGGVLGVQKNQSFVYSSLPSGNVKHSSRPFPSV